MTFKAICFAAAAAATFGTVADAAVIHATGVTWVNNGTVGTEDGRDNPMNALGVTDGTFLSLGLGGTADFTFGSKFTGALTVVEETFKREGYFERALAFGGLGGTFTYLGLLSNQMPTSTLEFDGIYDTIRLVDISSGEGRDGFDVDSISVNAIPLPASALLLGAGLAGLGVARRKA